VGADEEEENIGFSMPPLMEDRLWRHPAEVGQLKRVNQSVRRLRTFGKLAVCLGVFLLWGDEIFSLLS
jgi:uncharacterized protein YjeT (DUF2065 family)